MDGEYGRGGSADWKDKHRREAPGGSHQIMVRGPECREIFIDNDMQEDLTEEKPRKPLRPLRLCGEQLNWRE